MRWSSGFRDTLIFDGTARGPSGGLTARRVDGLRRLLFLLGLPEDLVVRAGSLEDCESVSHAPGDERFRRVEEDEVDELVERIKVDVSLLEPFLVALELGGVIGREPHD